MTLWNSVGMIRIQRHLLKHRISESLKCSKKIPTYVSAAVKCFGILSSLFFPNQIDQSSWRILITHAKIRSVLGDD